MRILIENYQYRVSVVADVLQGLDVLENMDGFVSVNYVGYFYNTHLLEPDCVFILPKVLLEDTQEGERVFGKYHPESIINLDANNPLTTIERAFIYEFSVWIYRAIIVFKSDKRNDTGIVFHKHIVQVGKSFKRLSNTFLDILIALVKFNRDNQNYFFYVLRNQHAGYNKINWTRTITATPAIVQDNCSVYLRPVNKKRTINFDEELLVIFFSILNYLGEHYGFPKNINCHFDLISGKTFERYLHKGYGKLRLREIKYKYFSDKALELWNLCYAFFDYAKKVYVNQEQKEYLLVKDFNIVFESIIDELIGDKHIPAGLKKQQDGKRIDHLFTYQSLTINEQDKPIYYIGDSKYYKRGNEIGRESIYKQFTYARNVIQWNLNLFMNGDSSDLDRQADKRDFGSVGKLRDDVTEGYNIIPNFFISAKLNKELSYKEEFELTDKKRSHFDNKQFENRLFDRDTLLVCHYDVNFLYVVALYARNHTIQKQEWREKVRATFRLEIQKMLDEKYQFYAMVARPMTNARSYIKSHFQEILGKIYTPYKEKNVFSLALDKDDPENNNARLLDELRQHFYVEPCTIGQDPHNVLASIPQTSSLSNGKNGILMIMIENYDHRAPELLASCKIAVGLKYTREGFMVAENIQTIGYVLFHHRSNEGKHLFALTAPCAIKSKIEIESNRAVTIKTADFYICADVDTSKELDASFLDVTKAQHSPQTRYDAQFVKSEQLLR